MKKSVLLLLIVFCCIKVNSQVLKGVVRDTEKYPIPGAYIRAHNVDEHTHTDNRGLFTLENIEVGDSITVVSMGSKTKTVSIVSLTENLEVILEASTTHLSEVYISPELNALNVFTNIDLKTYPVQSSQDLLRKVPGLFIGQHAGGGKAEQMFLRGFDLDHGTDINITVDGMPVNMVSHAHGQGYSDLHFLIPETVNKIDFGKGPYNADKGNFATAGYVNFETKDYLDASLVQFERGQFNTMRTLAMLDLINKDQQSAYVATEYIKTDGPFESPQNFDRINLFGKYTTFLNNNKDKLSLTGSYFTSKWDASGQIPQRAVDNGTINRFGAIDDTEGGKTSRANLAIEFDKHISDSTYVKNTFYYSKYNFDLFSNFTFFLNDSVNGDQIHQFENRELFGGQSEWNHKLKLLSKPTDLKIGVGLRNDRSNNNELSHTKNREVTLDSIQLGDINETNLFSYANADIKVNKWIINPGIRIDYFQFNYNNNLQAVYKTTSVTKTTISPKFNLLYNATRELQFYLKTGKGFHSNDTRVVTSQTGKRILPSAYGSDLGLIWKASSKVILNTAIWYLFSEQEFIYVGDEGVVEPGGRTQRLGADLGIRYQATNWLFFDVDVNYANARSIDSPDGENYVPLAPNFTSTGGFGVQNLKGFYGGLRYRFINDRPANEDNSIVAEGYFVVDMNAGYQRKHFDIGVAIQNILNTEWNETQFATESRLANETSSVEEIHFTPGTPFFAKLIMKYKF